MAEGGRGGVGAEGRSEAASEGGLGITNTALCVIFSHGNSSIALRVSSQLIGRFEDKSNRPFLRTSFALGRAGFSTRVSTIWLGPMTSGIQESLGRAGAGSVTRLRLSECNTRMLWV